MSSKSVNVKSYWLVWAALIILLLLTWGVAEFDLGILNPVVALVIAFIKMSLVILFFMHVKYNSPLTRVFAAAGFVWFLIMVTLTMSDYLSRGLVRPTNKAISFWQYGPPQIPPGDYPGGVNPSGLQQQPAVGKQQTGK
ncbi:MAG TPA: cytochrome C oxidase subunit IV family protein [Candidatus Angelobacter sp.]|nr:cytochrome C oxidase subunit IV family protein [Candidatus Angelobacter sp.]